MPGVTVGAKSIIGSGAVVTKDIPPNSFAAGVPAKVIGPIQNIMDKIDEEELLRRIMKIAEDIPNFFGFKVISNEVKTTGSTLTIDVHGKQWKIIVSRSQNLENLGQTNSSDKMVLLLSSHLRKT